MRILGIDFGEKKIGIAFCDTKYDIILPCDYILNITNKEVLDALLKIVENKKINKVVLGIPKSQKYKSKIEKKTEQFYLFLKDNIDIEIDIVDENLTTFSALDRLENIDIKKQKDMKDSVSAMKIIEYYLDNY